MTSGTATAAWLGERYPGGTRVHVFGEDSLRTAMVEQGFVLADDDVEVVAASIDWGVSYDKIKRAAVLIRKGAAFVATNLDPTRPTEEGLVPGTGALIAAIEVGAGVKPTAIGKPEPTMFEMAVEQMGATPETTATLGDRIDTDIEGGKRAGLHTILVLSGSTARAEAEAYRAGRWARLHFRGHRRTAVGLAGAVRTARRTNVNTGMRNFTLLLPHASMCADLDAAKGCIGQSYGGHYGR